MRYEEIIVKALKKQATVFSQIPNLVYLWTAVLIFAASSSITRKVTEIGAMHLINGRNPISLCNVLFVGNLCALVVMGLIFGKEWQQSILKQIQRSEWFYLATVAILSGALAPGLIFTALDRTTVTNVVLIGRLEPPLVLAFSALFLGIRVNLWTVAGCLIAFVGVAVTALLGSSNPTVSVMGNLFQIGQGEILAMIGAFLLALATVIGKAKLHQVPLGIFNLVRVGLGTVVFFVLAKSLYGTQHFIDVFSPVLWQWMLLYGAVIVVAGQLCWFVGIRHATPTETNLANSCSPVVAIAMAYLILREVPTTAQYVGGAIILVGIGLSLIGSLQEANARRMNRITPGQQMGMVVGFRGI